MAVSIVHRRLWFVLLLVATYIFTVTTITINILQIFSLVLLPINKQLYRKVNFYLAQCCYSVFVFAITSLGKCELKVYMDPRESEQMKREHKVVIMNHSSEVDWMIPMLLFEKYNCLGGMKSFVKENLKYIPLLGWMIQFLDFIMITRKLEKDEQRIKKGMLKLLDYPKGYWVSVFLMAEGTRFTAEKHESSLKIAETKNLPKLKHHLLPRTKGFCFTVDTARGKMEAVYDICMAVEGTRKISLMNIVKGHSFIIHMRIKRHALKDMPATQEGLSKWMFDLYREKDDIMEQYYQKKMFDLPEQHIPSHLYPAIVFIGCFIVAVPPLLYSIATGFIAGTLLQKVIIILSFPIFFVFANWLMNFSDIKNSSKYGVSKQK